MGYNPNISHLYVGYDPLTNPLLTSWDIQVHFSPDFKASFQNGSGIKIQGFLHHSLAYLDSSVERWKRWWCFASPQSLKCFGGQNVHIFPAWN